MSVRFAVEMLGPAGLLEAGDARAVDAGYWSYELLWSRAGTRILFQTVTGRGSP